MDEMDFEDLHGEPVDLDGCDVTGDPQLDQFGYNSPRRRGQNLTGFTSTDGERLARWRARQDREAAKRKADRAAVQANLDETRRRNAERRGGTAARQPVMPALPAHVSQAVAEGMAAGRDLGWWRVDVSPDGTAQWTRVDAPGDGPRMTVEQPPAPNAVPQWHPVEEQTQPSPGTRVW